jgi:voltage-gated potassium channel
MSLAMGFCLTVLTLALQCAGIVALIEWLRRLAPRNLRDLRVFRSAILVLQTTVALLVLHGLIISLWASCYHWLCVPSWDSSLYFSACTYATVGYADVVLSPRWRMLGPLESVIGVLMCGLSVSFLFALVNRLIPASETQ